MTDWKKLKGYRICGSVTIHMKGKLYDEIVNQFDRQLEHYTTLRLIESLHSTVAEPQDYFIAGIAHNPVVLEVLIEEMIELDYKSIV